MSTLHWTTQPPTQQGWWWHRTGKPAAGGRLPRGIPRVIEVWSAAGDYWANELEYPVRTLGGDWAGPIPEPEEAT